MLYLIPIYLHMCLKTHSKFSLFFNVHFFSLTLSVSAPEACYSRKRNPLIYIFSMYVCWCIFLNVSILQSYNISILCVYV